MKIKDVKTIFQWLDNGHKPSSIATYTGINPDLIDSIVEIYNADVDLELYA